MSRKPRFDEELEKIGYINRNEWLVVGGFGMILIICMCLILWAVSEISLRAM